MRGGDDLDRRHGFSGGYTLTETDSPHRSAWPLAAYRWWSAVAGGVCGWRVG